MSSETQDRLFDHIEQEFGKITLETELRDIERIVCKDDVQLLSVARGIIRVCFDTLGLVGTNAAIDRIDARLAEFGVLPPPPSPLKIPEALLDSLHHLHPYNQLKDEELSGTFNPNWVSLPGHTVKEAIEEKGVSVRDMALKMQIPVSALQLVITGHMPIDKGLAERFSTHLGATSDFWLNRQRNFDEGVSRGLKVV